MRNIKIISFTILSLLIASCGSKSDKDMFEEATKLVTEKKYDEAVQIFEEITHEYKDSEISPKAIFELAKLYQAQLIKNLDPKESLFKSVDAYKKVYNDYPASSDAENALFMAGFILANDLGDLEAAKETYELYLEKYPDGQLADDAKVELENLGKTPEEILRDKIQEESTNAQTI